ncbi:hypothetical protein E2562_020103 [Oryza meyeriana var. granulata]|uniref:Uncharacterized protein n=1 Tax=Oryza meyeriana var. granulata TaxID=110450 RepID=A0A6G1EAN5_9ORYZ|nr:hypothetical protein E2562_020103 [Oryza meyeriana var. granulata]
MRAISASAYPVRTHKEFDLLCVAHPLLPHLEFRLPDEFSNSVRRPRRRSASVAASPWRWSPRCCSARTRLRRRACATPTSPRLRSRAAPAGSDDCVALRLPIWDECLAVARPGDARGGLGAPPRAMRKVLSVVHGAPQEGSIYAGVLRRHGAARLHPAGRQRSAAADREVRTWSSGLQAVPRRERMRYARW